MCLSIANRFRQLAAYHIHWTAVTQSQMTETSQRQQRSITGPTKHCTVRTDRTGRGIAARKAQINYCDPNPNS